MKTGQRYIQMNMPGINGIVFFIYPYEKNNIYIFILSLYTKIFSMISTYTINSK